MVFGTSLMEQKLFLIFRTEMGLHAKNLSCKDCALATIVLSLEPLLLYLIGDPDDPGVVWKKLADQFQKKTWANKLALRRRLSYLPTPPLGSIFKRSLTGLNSEYSFS